MVSAHRQEAGKALASYIKNSPFVLKDKKNLMVVSLLRGGVVVGLEIARILQCPHIPLVVTKISHPHQEELALGAVCYDVVHLDKDIIQQLHIDKTLCKKQVGITRIKFNNYIKRYDLPEKFYKKLEDKTIIVVDDGIATGATVQAAYRFVKNKHPKKIILAAPVGPMDFSSQEFDEVYILHRDPAFRSVSDYYNDFPQVTDKEVKAVISDR